MKNFGKTISDRRKELGISQKDLASRVKKEDGIAISAQYLNDIEHDRRNPPNEEIIAQFATELQLDKEELCVIAGTVPKEYRDKFLASSDEEKKQAIKVFRRIFK